MAKKLADQIKRLGSVLSGLATIVEEIDREESVKETEKRRCDCANQTPYCPCLQCHSYPLQLGYLSYQYPYPYPVLVLQRPPYDQPRRKQSSNSGVENNSGSYDGKKQRKQSKNKNEEDNNSGSICSNGRQCQSNGNEGDNNSGSSCNNEKCQSNGNEGDNNSGSFSEPRKQSKNWNEGDNSESSYNNNGTRKQSRNGNEGDYHSGNPYNNNGARKQSRNGNEGDNNSGSFYNNNGARKQSSNGNEGDNNSGSFYNNYNVNSNYEEKCTCLCCQEYNASVDDKPCCYFETGCLNCSNSDTSRRSDVSENRTSINRQECNCRVGDYRRRKTDLYPVQCYDY